MIDVKELRIGNWVSGKNDPEMKVVSISNGSVELRFNGVGEDYGDWYYDDDELKPIPLTPEILEKCGFKYLKEQNVWFRDGMNEYLTLHYNGFCVYESTKKRIIKSLHELQNLYFSLTGKEIEIELLTLTFP